VVERLIGGVLYPVLSKMGRDQDTPTLRRIFYRSRLPLDLVAQGGLGLLCGIGGWLIELVWDPRYWGAAWMLRILCIRAATSCLAQPIEACVVSMGFPRYGFWRSVLRATSIWIGLPLGYWLAGVPGLLWAVAFSEVPAMLLLWVVFWRMRMLRIERELLAIGMFVAAFSLANSVRPLLPDWHLPHRSSEVAD
jgi:O-antigen/teichoic acid export membrane protein